MIALVRGNLPVEVETCASLGWHCYPCSRVSRAALWAGGHHDATCDLALLRAWAYEHPGCNWRVLCGPSRLFALDIDNAGEDHDADGLAAWHRLLAQPGHELPRSAEGRALVPVARSGGGGLLLVFRHPPGEKIVGRSGTPLPGIDPLRGMQSITIPPSLHLRTRREYRWLTAPWEVAPPDPPEWLLRLLRPVEPLVLEARQPGAGTETWAERTMDSACYRVERAAKGERNNTLNRSAYWVSRICAAGLLSEQVALDALFFAARRAGLDDPSIRSTLISAFTAGRAKPYDAKEFRP